jgi:universal stress protein E
MKPVRRILFAVKNTGARRHAAADKAIRIAKSLGASLEFFNAISTPVFLEVQPLTGTSVAELRRESLALRTRQLEKLAARARKHGVQASGAAEWDFPPHEAIVRRARKVGADLVIAEVHEGRRIAPWLMHLTDWELLRECPMPVLLLKKTHAWRRPVILAAVDPSHAHAKPSGLDDAIVGHALGFARKLGGTLEVMHADYPPLMGFAFGDPSIDAAALEAAYEAQRKHDRRAFDAFADGAGIPDARRHLVGGGPLVAIPKAARHLGADLVVMGALSRSGLKRIFIGNTAERVLGALPCDVLVVKPPGVARPARRAARGMRVVAATPMLPVSA